MDYNIGVLCAVVVNAVVAVALTVSLFADLTVDHCYFPSTRSKNSHYFCWSILYVFDYCLQIWGKKERSTNWNGQLQRNFCETKNSIESIVEFDLFEKRDFLISHIITKMEKKSTNWEKIMNWKKKLINIERGKKN